MPRTLNIVCLQTEPKSDFGSTPEEAISRIEVAVPAISIAVAGTDGPVYNHTIIVDNAGCVCTRNDKPHLFDIALSAQQTYTESKTVVPGNVAVVAETPFAKIGLSLCCDLRFPLLYRDVAQAGAETQRAVA